MAKKFFTSDSWTSFIDTIKSLFDSKVDSSTTVNGKALSSNITLSAGDVSAYTKTEIDSKVSTLNTAINGKANSSHAHAISDVTNLQSTLDGKAASSHTHTVANITDLTATATELNYMDGVTSSVQSQLDSKANSSDLSSHTSNKSNPHGVTLAQLGVTATAAEVNYTAGVTSAIQTQLNKKAGDYTVEIYNGTGGNPKPVKFITVNYSTCTSEAGVAIKVGMVSGHGNGSSYAFLQDAIIKVGYTGNVEVDNFKYYGASTGTYEGANRQYGDIFWVIDTTNKIVDFYVLMGQYARIQMTPYKRVTYSTGGTITQYTSATVYSSGDKVWGNNDEFALSSEIANLESQLNTLVASTVSVLSGTSEPDATLGEDGDVYLVTE